jgi:4-hydroxy-tetrahydrodipicolinate synthase
MVSFKGVIAVLPTPFQVNGSVDQASLANLVDYFAAQPIHGLATLALHSEGYKLTADERRMVLRTVVETAAQRMPIIAGVAHEATLGAVALADEAASIGADGLMVLPPSFVKQLESALVDHFVAVSRVTDLPVIIQDSPQLTGIRMSPHFLKTINSQSDNVKYVKVEELPAGHKISQLVSAFGSLINALCGWGGLEWLEALRRGAVGCMPAAESSPILAQAYTAFQNNQPEKAQEIFDPIIPLLSFASRSLDRFIIVSKLILARRGVIATNTLRPPYTPLDRVEQEEVERLILQSGMV